jgi:hypothetical protein
MNGKLLAQLAWVAQRDADAQLPDPYKWPERDPPPTEEQRREYDRLRILCSRLFYHARCAGWVGNDGTDAVFG